MNVDVWPLILFFQILRQWVSMPYVLLRAGDAAHSRGKRIVDSLKRRATVRMTTDEIMALTRGEH